jgi:hypothetical protein
LAARKLGDSYLVYHPSGIDSPLDERNRVIRLFASFKQQGHDGRSRALPVWQATFDCYYTQPGDYLVGDTRTFFVACQETALPPLCISTNRVVTVVRPSFAPQGGYSGLGAAAGEVVLAGWPGSLLENGGYGELPRAGGHGFGACTLLLPCLPAAPKVADVVTDETDGTYVVGAAESNALGWRLLLRHVGA